MKLFFIKVGKAFSAIKREGLFRGGIRVFQAFVNLFGRVAAGDVLFITNGVGNSAAYRCHNVAEELEIHGFKCSITVQDNPFLATYADKFKVFIFHRVVFTSGVQKLIEEIKKQNKEIIFEIDDLVFDPKYLVHMDYYQKMNSLEKKLYENGMGGEILRDPYVKVCTTTTTYLAEKLREYNKQVFIVPNRLSNKDLEIAEKIINKKLLVNNYQLSKNDNGSPITDNKIKLGYFSGTISHNKDFATTTDALMLIMEKYLQVELFLAGPLDVENKLNKFGDKIKQLPFVPRKEHLENISKVDINLAPLEINNPFCEAKSELKFFEAGVVGVPTVAVANQTFSETIEDGVDGFLAGDTKEWVEKLSRLIEDENLRKKMGEKAREKTLKNYTNKNSNNQEYYEYLKVTIDRLTS